MNRGTTCTVLIASASLCALALFGNGKVQHEQPGTLDASQAEITAAKGLSRAFQTVARKLEPSVVHITQLNRVMQVRRDYFGQPMATGQSRLSPTGLGSGVIVSADGYILTNNHVAKGAESLLVRLSDGKEYPAKLVGRDEATDLAVIKVDAKNLPAAQLADSDALEVGEWVVAIGSPFGFSSSVTAGIVSAKGRSGIEGLQEYQDFIQTDAVINPGNSGGPLINLDGKVIGINSAIASRTGGSEGIGFAIPANVAKPVMQSLIKSGRVSRGWLGVEFGADRDDVLPAPGSERHVTIARVVDGSPAAKAGLRPGDVVTAFQGRRVDDISRLRAAIALTPPETTVAIDVVRNGSPVSMRAEVGDQSRERAAALGAVYIENAGLTARTMTPDLSSQIGFRQPVAGALILDVEPVSRAAQAGLAPRDIIAEVNGDPIETAEELQTALGRPSNGGEGLKLSVIRPTGRGVQQGYVMLRD